MCESSNTVHGRATPWPCFGRCGSTITNPRTANIEYQPTDDAFSSFATMRAIHKECHWGPDNEWLWCPATAFAGPRGFARAKSWASSCSGDASWLVAGARQLSDHPNFDEESPELAALFGLGNT